MYTHIHSNSGILARQQGPKPVSGDKQKIREKTFRNAAATPEPRQVNVCTYTCTSQQQQQCVHSHGDPSPLPRLLDHVECDCCPVLLLAHTSSEERTSPIEGNSENLIEGGREGGEVNFNFTQNTKKGDVYTKSVVALRY